jgi:hypothetical protein
MAALLFEPARHSREETALELAGYAHGDDELRLRMMIAAQYDAPAYIRRARGVEAAYESLLNRCRQKRVKWLLGVRLHIGSLRARIRDWMELRPLLADDEQIVVLRCLHAEVGDPEHPMTGPLDGRGRRRVLTRLQAAVVNEVNRFRDGYNRYFLLEKECALGPVRLMPQLFRKLAPLTPTDVLAELPLLRMPQLSNGY